MLNERMLRGTIRKVDDRRQMIDDACYPVLFPILRTKLEPPRRRTGLITRSHLVERLDQGLKRALTLVHAPAGFGKSTLVQQWLERPELPRVGWVWLDEDDNELARFVAYAVSAVQSVFPASCQQTRSLLFLPVSVPAPLLVSTLLNELSELPEPFVLVLEEYDAIRNEAVHHLLSQFVEYQLPHLHLVVVTRAAPPLNVAHLRQRRIVSEIGAEDLRLTVPETAAILAQVADGTTDETEAALLHAKTEGWVGGLHLVAAADHHEHDLKEFFWEEVLAGCSLDVHEFLLETSLFERFCPALVASVSEVTPSSAAADAVLRQLLRASLFVHPVDAPAGWYRYHRLLREALRQELVQQRGSDEIALLHRRAAGWFEAHGEIDLALSHWLAAGEQGAAAELVERQVGEALATEAMPALARWLARLPAQLIRLRPGLLLADAWVRQEQMFLPDIEDQLNMIEELLEKGAGAVPEMVAAGAATLASDFWYWRGDAARSQVMAQDACERVSASDRFMAACALARSVTSRQLAGTAEDALRQLDATLQLPGLEAGAMAQLLRARALAQLNGGRLSEVECSAIALQRLAEEHGLAGSASWAHYLLGRVYYEWDRLAEAASHFGAVVETPEGAASLPLHESHLGLALIHQIRGESEVAHELVAALQECLWERGAFFISSVDSFEARLALLRGELPLAARVMRQQAPAHDTQNLLLLEIPELTRTRILIAQNTPVSLEEAMGALRTLQRVTQNTHNRVRHVEVLALRALVLEAQGETEGALPVLEQALAVAEPGGLVRTLVEFGPPMAAQLYRFAMNGSANVYARHLLTAFPRLSQPTIVPAEEEVFDTQEALTDREWEVLTLMGRRLSNKEIADHLVISPHTVKKHASNIYQKLDVNSRRQAISRARQLGLLPIPVESGPFPAFA